MLETTIEERFIALESEVNRLRAIVKEMQSSPTHTKTTGEKRQALEAFLAGTKRPLGGPLSREELYESRLIGG